MITAGRNRKLSGITTNVVYVTNIFKLFTVLDNNSGNQIMFKIDRTSDHLHQLYGASIGCILNISCTLVGKRRQAKLNHLTDVANG